MRQSAFTIMTSINRGDVGDLARLLNDIGDHIDDNAYICFDDLEDLHYLSFFVVEDADDPYLVFEGNVDGRRDAFLKQLLSSAPKAVDEIYRHCVDYPAAGSQDPTAALEYLRAHDIGTNTFYVAWPGWTVGEIRREQQLRDSIEAFLDEQEGSDLRRQTGETVRRRIANRVADDPSMGWALSAPSKPFLVKHGKKVLYLIATPPALTLTGLLKAGLGRSPSGRRSFARMILVSLLATVGLAARQLRNEEMKDEREDRRRVPDWQTTYARWSENLGGIVRRENIQVQNHMASVTKIKDGWFRLTTLRVVLWVINLLARLTANKGRLGGISSIHFARWVITPDKKSLIFMSNFDGSWESYLNQFIDLAAQGLTAVWTNSDNAVGFPRTRWLVREGARDEARFKAFGRYSMVPTNTWYSAYPDLTVSNIENNMLIRRDLFAPHDPPATEAWLRRL